MKLSKVIFTIGLVLLASGFFIGCDTTADEGDSISDETISKYEVALASLSEQFTESATSGTGYDVVIVNDPYSITVTYDEYACHTYSYNDVTEEYTYFSDLSGITVSGTYVFSVTTTGSVTEVSMVFQGTFTGASVSSFSGSAVIVSDSSSGTGSVSGTLVIDGESFSYSELLTY